MRRLAIAAVAAATFAGTAPAQQWPAKPVRVIVNVAPGGVADITARLLGARLTETLGQPFVVENRAGGDGYIGFEAVAPASPDGYTFVYAPGSTMMIAPHLVRRADFDPVKVLTPVVATGSVSLYVIVKLDPRQRRDVAITPKGGWLSRGRCANALIRARTTAGNCSGHSTP